MDYSMETSRKVEIEDGGMEIFDEIVNLAFEISTATY